MNQSEALEWLLENGGEHESVEESSEPNTESSACSSTLHKKSVSSLGKCLRRPYFNNF